MRQRLIAFAVFTAFAAPAFADDSVTLYGILDAAVVNVQHSLNFDPFLSQTTVPTPTKSGNNAATGVVSGGISASRWGLRGQEDLPGGWAAIFDLESAININSGNISNGAETLANQKATGPNVSNDSSLSGQLFGRAAYLGLSSPTYGTFTLGRNPNIGLDLIPIYDPLRGSPQMFSPIGFSSSYAGGGYTDDARVDGSVKYGLRIGDVKIGALYKFGGIAGAAEANSGGEFNIGYEAGPFGIQGLYESFKDATSLSNANGTTIPLGSLGVTFANTRVDSAVAL